MSNKIRKKRKSTAHSKLKSLYVMFKGITVSWSVVDPLSEAGDSDLYNTKITHSKMQYRSLIEVHDTKIREFIQNGDHNWKVDVDVEFKKPDGEEYVKGAVLYAKCPFHEMDDEIGDQIEIILAGCNMKHYVTTRMTCEIV